ncbi:hypothetical protein LDVICp126 [lymphocystis disease virus-China]|uniref:Uncharacterized protein n=1 Tax=lymphocystis disease virus-China TaxID=256729 RepID=Q677Y6_9VIRU|nr:hypothetical protein LDVICp126 [lymphocystis disease virus-China]AAU10971.1 hypothetical protein [lymphocystis disease virus-China]
MLTTLSKFHKISYILKDGYNNAIHIDIIQADQLHQSTHLIMKYSGFLYIYNYRSYLS